jgi:hypothetical protein
MRPKSVDPVYLVDELSTKLDDRQHTGATKD